MPVDLHISDTVFLDISAAGNQVRVNGIVVRLAEWDYVILTCSLLHQTVTATHRNRRRARRSAKWRLVGIQRTV